LNIAEGNGKRSLKDRHRFLDVARGSVLECAAIQDVAAATAGTDDESHRKVKHILERIVSMLTRLIARDDMARENSGEYAGEGEYEYRDAEFETAYGSEQE